MIPTHWGICYLNDLFSFNSGLAVSRKELSNDGFCYLHYGDIHKSNKTYIDVTKEYQDIPKLNIPLKIIPPKTLLNDGDVVFVDASEDDEGTSKHIVIKNPDNIIFVSGLHTIVLKSKNTLLNNDYKQYCFQTAQLRKQFKFFAVGTKVSGINKTNIKKVQILLPSKPEQMAIASVLSDVDSLISTLEKLITKKRNIKQGAMQELLTGKKRLPGFSGEWKVRSIKEIGKAYGGLSGKSKDDFINGKYPYIPFLNIINNPVIDTSYFDYVNIKTEEKQNRAQKGDLFFNGSSETPEEVGMCSVLMEDITNLYLNSFCFGFRLFKDMDVDGLYLSYYFRSNQGRYLFYILAQGATRYNLSKAAFYEMKMPSPELKEQRAIVTILSEMDGEIEALEQKLAKYRMIKQGMMQELLTGKTRLV